MAKVTTITIDGTNYRVHKAKHQGNDTGNGYVPAARTLEDIAEHIESGRISEEQVIDFYHYGGGIRMQAKTRPTPNKKMGMDDLKRLWPQVSNDITDFEERQNACQLLFENEQEKGSVTLKYAFPSKVLTEQPIAD